MNFKIFCDGGARGNPGPAAIGFVVFEKEKPLKKFSQKIGRATNNVAEYQAVIAALEWLKKISLTKKMKPPRAKLGVSFALERMERRGIRRSEIKRVDFYLDSELVVNQLRGIYKVKDQKLRKLIILVKDLERTLATKIVYHRVRREENKVADFLVNQALRK